MKIGIIQSRGIGDIIIAAPIAQHLINEGNEIYWPIDARFLSFMASAFPAIHFLPIHTEITGDQTIEYFYKNPHKQLIEVNCQKIYCLYSHLTNVDLPGRNFAKSLKFDEYKYAISGVSFDKKWSLDIKRSSEREEYLKKTLNITRPYVVTHEQGSDFNISITVPAEVKQRFQVIKIENLTDNPFDWLGVIAHASKLFFIDSFFSNLVEQLNFNMEKYLILRSDVPFTPVFKNNWIFI